MEGAPVERPLWTQMVPKPGRECLNFFWYFVTTSYEGYATSSSSIRQRIIRLLGSSSTFALLFAT